MVTDLLPELSEMISLGVLNITKMLLKKAFRATRADKAQKMEEVKAFAEREKKKDTIKKPVVTQNWFDADGGEDDDDEKKAEARKAEEAEEPILADKEKIIQEIFEQSQGTVSKQMLDKIFAKMEKGKKEKWSE